MNRENGESIPASRRHVVQRANVVETDIERSKSRFSQHASVLVKEHLRELTPDMPDPAKVISDPETSWGPFKTHGEFQLYKDERIRTFLGGPQRLLDLSFQLGDHILVPPYDNGWAVGAASFAPHFEGKLMIIGTAGESNSGISVFLTSEVPALVSVAPIGAYKYDAGALATYPALRSRGGLGILVYDESSFTPLLVQQATVWSFAGVVQFQSITASGRISDVNQASAVFGPIPLVPITFNMQPNKRYEVWFWAWMINVFPDPNTAFLSAFSADVPMMSVSAGPPIILH